MERIEYYYSEILRNAKRICQRRDIRSIEIKEEIESLLIINFNDLTRALSVEILSLRGVYSAEECREQENHLRRFFNTDRERKINCIF